MYSVHSRSSSTEFAGTFAMMAQPHRCHWNIGLPGFFSPVHLLIGDLQMFSGQRDFRAIAVWSSSKEFPPLSEIFPKDAVAKQLTMVSDANPSFIVRHGYYYSSTEYASLDVLADARVPQGRSFKYRYDFYACEWERPKGSCIVFAVPFGKMAVDMFGTVEEKLRPAKRAFERINLDLLVSQLAAEEPISSDITATSLRCRVIGDDKVQTAVYSGSDVIASQLYRRTTSALRGIRLVPRRVKVKYEQAPIRFSTEMDAHGNYWFHVSKDGTNVASLFEVLNTLDRANLVERTIEYPLREGIRREEHESHVLSP
jgi:hypothetical protein